MANKNEEVYVRLMPDVIRHPEKYGGMPKGLSIGDRALNWKWLGRDSGTGENLLMRRETTPAYARLKDGDFYFLTKSMHGGYCAAEGYEVRLQLVRLSGRAVKESSDAVTVSLAKNLPDAVAEANGLAEELRKKMLAGGGEIKGRWNGAAISAIMPQTGAEYRLWADVAGITTLRRF